MRYGYIISLRITFEKQHFLIYWISFIIISCSNNVYVKFEDSGCGSVAERSLPTLQFESSHRQNIIKNMCLLLTVEKKKIKKRPGMAH